MEYASNGKGNLGVTLGAIGTGLSLLNGNGNGILSGVIGGNSSNYVTNEMLDIQLKLVDAQKQNAVLSADLSSEKKMVEVFNAANDKINNVYEKVSDRILSLEQTVANNAASQAVINCNYASSINLLQNQAAQLYSMTKMVIPNTNVCPGWGDVTVSVTPTTSTTTTA